MIAGVSGNLVSHSFGEHVLPGSFAGRLGEDGRAEGRRALKAWWQRHGRRFGPASSVRDLFDLGAVPVLQALGHEPLLRAVEADPPMAAALVHAGPARAPLIVLPWGAPMVDAHVELARRAAGSGARWGIAFNGTGVRLVDVGRAYARRHVEFGFEAIIEHRPSFHLFWALMRAPAFEALLELVAAASVEHGIGVCTSLRTGVIESVELLMTAMLGRHRGARPRVRAGVRLAGAYEQAITVVYRVLFLLFAESRGLLPTWHPAYRDAYSIAALRTAAERSSSRPAVWEMLQAVSRMAHAGCRAEDLQVTAFNGRLFAPGRTPLAERPGANDALVSRAVIALTTRQGPTGRERIAFRDLGVEQLGAVYESVLDYEPAAAPTRVGAAGSTSEGPIRLRSTGTKRKSSGTFYTPLAITEHLVHATLGPLTDNASAEAILGLKVVDPAMGSGAFLVAACRYLAGAYERALVRDTGRMASDVTDDERVGYRRLVAQRCLYGVDVNPMAVQVARLSMWLTTLAADQPLTFLDHHFAAGDSLVGASIDDVARQRPGPRRVGWQGVEELPFEPADVGLVLKQVLPIRERLAEQPDDQAVVVRDKEAALQRLTRRDGPLVPLLRLANAWCAWWFWDESETPRPSPGEYADVMRAAGGQRASLRDGFVAPRLSAIDRVARDRRFFHWTLAFPEVYYDDSGAPLQGGGFDAVIGNPPWEMVRGDTGFADERARTRQFGRQLTGFARESGTYRASGSGHLNLYQLFVERALRLARPGGRVGLVVPWGLCSDQGSSALRRYLFERCTTSQISAFENTAGIFPIHRGLRFAVLTSSPGGSTERMRCHFGLRDVEQLNRPDGTASDSDDASGPTVLTPSLLSVLSGSRLSVPYVRGPRDLALLESLAHRFPPLAEAGGWHARFGRELNATDDAHVFEARRPGGGKSDRPVIEGRQIEPFAVDISASRLALKTGSTVRPDVEAAMSRWRVAYRDVAAATNRLTLIAALVPPRAVTVHTVFCLKTDMPLPDQHGLCALLNSFVLNFLARLWVTTHVTTDIVEHLPAPSRYDNRRVLEAISALAVRLGHRPGDIGLAARLQADVGRLYGLTREEMAHILGTFPLVDEAYRAAVIEGFRGRGSEV